MCLHRHTKVLERSRKHFIGILCRTFWNFVGVVTRREYRDRNSQIRNRFENVYKSWKIFVANLVEN